MHALHLPPRHILRVTVLAAALAVVIMALLAVPAGELLTRDGSSASAGEASSTTAAPPAPVVDTRPAWASDPLAPVSLR